jgi:hypothetical protein
MGTQAARVAVWVPTVVPGSVPRAVQTTNAPAGAQAPIATQFANPSGLTDGDMGDIVISGDGTVMEFDPTVVTPAGRALLDDPDAAAQLATLGAVAKAGDTLTGPLILAGPPTTDLEAANRKYVLDAISAGGGYTDENARDAIAAMLVGGTNVTLVVNDAADTLTINAATAAIIDAGTF